MNVFTLIITVSTNQIRSNIFDISGNTTRNPTRNFNKNNKDYHGIGPQDDFVSDSLSDSLHYQS